MARGKDDDTLRLKRERAGRYVTADGRFAVEGDAAGAWYMIDSERLDGLGLPLVRGPFPTLDAAREAVAGALGTAGDGPDTKDTPARAIAPARRLKAGPEILRRCRDGWIADRGTVEAALKTGSPCAGPGAARAPAIAGSRTSARPGADAAAGGSGPRPNQLAQPSRAGLPNPGRPG